MVKKNEVKYIVVTVAAVIAAVVAVVVGLVASRPEAISDDFFVSDGVKLVLKLNAETAAYEDSIYEPETTFVVYDYEEEKITGVKIYFQYFDEEEAKTAYENIGAKDWALTRVLNGRYIVFTLKPSQYSRLTTERVRDIIEGIKE